MLRSILYFACHNIFSFSLGEKNATSNIFNNNFIALFKLNGKYVTQRKNI